MSRDPVSRDVDTPANPHVLVLENIVQKSFQRGNTPGPSNDSCMQTDGQHLRRIEPGGISFAIQRVKRVTRVVKELRTRVEPLYSSKTHVIAVECIGHHEVR